MTPFAYEIKRIVALNGHQLWCAAALAKLPTAPVYLFPDQQQFNSDAVQVLARRNAEEPLRLPHDEVLLEVADQDSRLSAQVAFVRNVEERVEGFLLYRSRPGGKWSDIHCHAVFNPDGTADVESHGAIESAEDAHSHALALTGLVWRGLGLLSYAAHVREIPFPTMRRPKLARAGISGWTWRLVDIDPARVRAAVQEKQGTHAPPRWHIRRGHWRTLGDGRSVFVRDCEVGDRARGGVIKDYRVMQGVSR